MAFHYNTRSDKMLRTCRKFCRGKCEQSYFTLIVDTTGSSPGTLSNLSTTVSVSGNGYDKSTTSSSKTGSTTHTFTSVPAGTYTVKGTASIQYKNSSSGPAIFCALSIGGKLSDTKSVTVPGNTSISFAFSCGGIGDGGI